MSKRIGPKMAEAIAFVWGCNKVNEACTIHRVSVAVGPHGSNRYGYEIVKRCLAAGELYLMPSNHVPRNSAGILVTKQYASLIFSRIMADADKIREDAGIEHHGALNRNELALIVGIVMHEIHMDQYKARQAIAY